MTTSSIAAAPQLLDEVIQQRHERLAAFEREALLPDVLGVQVALEALGRRELPEDVAALLGAEAVLQPARLELVLQPQALVGVRHVRELGADRAGVDVLELRQDLAQLHPLRHRTRCGCR